MTIAVDSAGFGNDRTVDDTALVSRLPGLACAAVASIGAGAVHAAATGIHAEHPTLARLFVVVAVLQLGGGLLALVRPSRLIALGVAIVNIGAVTGWVATRVSGISWIEGLEVKEAPQFADTACALMGMAAAGAAVAATLVGWHMARPIRLMLPSLAAAALTIPAMISGGTHVHNHGDAAGAAHTHAEDATAASSSGGDDGSGAAGVAVADGHSHDESDGHSHDDSTTTTSPDGTAAAPVDESAPHSHDDGTSTTAADDGTATAATDEEAPHSHDDGTTTAADDGTATDSGTSTDGHSHDTPVASNNAGQSWPWPFDPAEPIDLSGVPGVTPVQLARAEGLVEASLRELPAFADVNVIEAFGYQSIGDGVTGFEHWINRNLIDGDDKFLDPKAPESLVYQVDKATGKKTLVSAMFIAKTGTPMDAFKLTDYAGSLMTWHAHNNLCWAPNAEGKVVIVGLTDANGNCARGVRGGGDNPMVHVWITPHQCGPFAALEGVGAGGAAVPEEERTDMCHEAHDEGHDDATEAEEETAPAVAPKKYDPTQPIDLSGVEGVTPEQQAAAENIVAVNVVRLPQWADYKTAEAAGFHSIGDGGTGHEHFIQWSWINDDVWLDPDHPESLVYEPQPDGTKKLVSAMYMLPDDVPLSDVPDIGGALMQWHIHNNLCFTKDPVAPKVGGLRAPDGECPAHLQKLPSAAMIHVWITQNKCGPFAALEGVGAGQVEDGEERLCDHVHGEGL